MPSRTIAVLLLAAAAALACESEPLTVGSRIDSRDLAAPASSAQLGPFGTELPFSGSFTTATSGVFTPPSTLTITGTATGNATHFGRFTATTVDVVNTTNATSTGTYFLTAANGDQLFTTTVGGEEEFIPPNISRIRLVATIVGGTGRFASTTGTFTINSTIAVDFAAGTSSGSGSFDGHIILKD
jgi:hypothetical protein